MNGKNFRRMKVGNYCSVGVFGENIFASEQLTGFADVPVYIQITKHEYENFSNNDEFGERKILCFGYKEEIDMSTVLSDEEIEQKKKDKSLWRAGVYSKEAYDGQGVVVLDFIPYKLTRRAYEDIPVDTTLLSGFKTVKKGYLWQMVYEEVKEKKHPKGTYCETIKCNICGDEFYFSDVPVPIHENYEVQCPKCKSMIVKRRILLNL